MQTRIDVLVVDHSDSHAELTLRALRRAAPDVAVLRLRDGDHALQFVFSTGAFSDRPHELPQLILLDVDRPFVNGLKLLAVLGRNPDTRTIPVVLLSSTGNPFAIDSSYALGACGYIVKQEDFGRYCSELRGITQRWLDRARAASER